MKKQDNSLQGWLHRNGMFTGIFVGLAIVLFIICYNIHAFKFPTLMANLLEIVFALVGGAIAGAGYVNHRGKSLDETKTRIVMYKLGFAFWITMTAIVMGLSMG